MGFKKLNNPNNPIDLTKLEYRTDIEPLTKYFEDTLSIDACFWKAGAIGKTNFGPSSFWMKGYAFISQENADCLKSLYHFENIDISWENGVSPEITGKSDFEWTYCRELSKKIAGTRFMGEIYFDIKNNIVYFDLESM